MAKKATVNTPVIDRALLAAIAAGTVTVVDYNQALAAGIKHEPNLIETGAVENGFAPVRITDHGKAFLSAPAQSVSVNQSAPSAFTIIGNAVLPKSKRGNTGGGAPNKYPFDQLEVNQTFFVPVSAKLPDPVKTLGSTVSSANMRYSEETGEHKNVTRAVRDGRKAKLDEHGHKIMETVSRPVLKYTRKFAIRGVKAGETYGGWTAEADGALIGRVE